MASSTRVRSRLRRLADVALEDFGLRRSPGRTAAPLEATPVDEATPVEAAAAGAETDEVVEATAIAEAAAAVVEVPAVDEATAILEATAVVEATAVLDTAAAIDEAPLTSLSVAPPGLAAAVPVTELPPGVVWRGAATRRPELQRFVEHLEALRGVS